MIDFGREICGHPDSASRREWLVTNGFGGYSSGTISGEITRRYQGLLVAALNPPLGRTLLVSKVEETVDYDGSTYILSTNRWNPDEIHPHGYTHIERFRLDGSIPVWTFACADALIEKRVWMERHQNSVHVRYEVVRARRPVTLTIEPVVNYRSNHNITESTERGVDISATGDGMQVRIGDDSPAFRLSMERADCDPQYAWSDRFYLSVDDDRGIHPHEYHLQVGHFRVTLEEGEASTFIATSEQDTQRSATALEERLQLDHDLVARSGLEDEPEPIRQLVLAADQFIVHRHFDDDADGRSIIAGYHWFEDWGRDTMIALPGLALATGRPDVAKSVLLTYGAAVSEGMLPNRFPEDGSEAVYNTIDATPWFFEAIRSYFESTGDVDLIRSIYPVLRDIVDWHERGTRFEIQFDPFDGLVRSGEEGAPLTWMDARMGDFLPTPRVGKPVEVNALWYNALCAMVDFAEETGEEPEHYRLLAKRLCEGFKRFWNDEKRYCFDVLDGPDGNDASLRPNQLLAVSLRHSPLDGWQHEAIVDSCARSLLTSHGLRSLSPDDDNYIRRYQGDLRKRDAAYHQGTVWSWLIGPFVSAHYRVYNDSEAARSFLQPLFLHLSDHGLGSISEIFDADPPFLARGCIAQAWGVAEILRTWRETME
jgi:predicted glycogen debranching enzyme